MIVALLALFGAGLASFLAPCVLPLVPGFLGVLGAQAPGDRIVRRALAFVAGFGTVFVALGVAAGAVGSLVRPDGVVARLGGGLVLLFGLGLLGVLPGRGGARWRSPRVTGVPSAVALGVVFGAAWTPCVGPLVGAALVAAGGAGSPWRGGVLLAAFATGLGAPFVAVAAGVAWSPAAYRRLRHGGRVLARVSGVVLVAAGLALAAGRYDAFVAVLRP